jgi:hypothetical protein
MIGLLAIGLFAPAATPQPIVDQIAKRTARDGGPGVPKVFDKAGLSPLPIQYREDTLPPGGGVLGRSSGR